ncbi:hypothetical protein [Spirosoma sp. KNUC1025]|uniref:hypothetical protein n=1 Tax=Spirosoma sp. KNUC1025 TaxID=2894082 RepID=UPI0038658507|nr:hypothetical protein LN737_24325 [Spirosoma sp. KNUC1025]
MAKHRSDYLINRLISSNLSKAELDEFLAGLHHAEDVNAYSDALEAYFDALLNEPENPPDPAEKPEPIVKEVKSDS